MGPVLKRQLKKWGLALVILFAVLEISGLKYRLFEKDYSSQFDYPMFGDITRQVDDILLSLSGSESGDKLNAMNAPYKNVQEDRKFCDVSAVTLHYDTFTALAKKIHTLIT